LITINDLSLAFGTDVLFKDVDLVFNPGNCYGVIGANGAGKSTFVKILSGELEPTSGTVTMPPNIRLSVLQQNQFLFDEYTVEETVIMGHTRMCAVRDEKDALYAKEDFSDVDGERASELEAEFAELGGWEAESDAAKLVTELGLSDEVMHEKMSSLTGSQKVKVLLANALFGKPDVILLDEPTNHLDVDAVNRLEDFISDYFGTVIVVSHDRHFLNNVCTHIVDIDYGKIKMYVGNYEFWYESSQLVQRLLKQQNKKAEEKIKELEEFIRRFAANKSKSKQATSRRKLIDKITPDEVPSSSRKYPYIYFGQDREAGRDVLLVKDLTVAVESQEMFKNVSFTVNKGDKIAFVSRNPNAVTALFEVLANSETAKYKGEIKYGQTITNSYFPVNSDNFFNGIQLNIVDWLKQYSADQSETFLRGFLGRMLFSGDDVYKPVTVLSGGEKVRCMFSRMMLFGSNFLILDQPTNHLDLESITAVNTALTEFKGTAIFSTHDREIMDTAASRVIEITPDGCRDYAGNYEGFVEWRKRKFGDTMEI
jgi:ATPase subunit of ABC transporter with duplicated ATPase domains